MKAENLPTRNVLYHHDTSIPTQSMVQVHLQNDHTIHILLQVTSLDNNCHLSHSHLLSKDVQKSEITLSNM